MKKSRRSLNTQHNNYDNINRNYYTPISSIPESLNKQHTYQGNSSQFTLTIYKKDNNEYSFTKPFPTIINTNNINKQHLPFKKRNWVSKLRSHDKAFRNAKNMKNLSKDIVDGIYYNAYQQLEAGPSIMPKRKYCDYTGFETSYTELNTGIRFHDAKIYQLFQKMSQPVKDQYLNIRKALIRLK